MRRELDRLLGIWFPDDLDSAEAIGERAATWFGGPSPLDDVLRAEFADLPDRVAARDVESWLDEPRQALAGVLALDQIPRNIHRGSPRAFEYDARAVDVAEALVDGGVDANLHPVEAAFIYLPFEHGESRALQTRSVERFGHLVERAPDGLQAQFEQFRDYAVRHERVIERFGRFPHRNEVLGRSSTPEEAAYLEAGGETFS